MMLGLGLGLSKNNALLQSFAQLVKSAGGVLYLDARKADGSGPLTGNDSPWVDKSGEGNNGTLTNFAGTDTSGWNEVANIDVNALENYDFSDGTDNWNSLDSTLSEVGQKISILGNGASTQPRVRQLDVFTNKRTDIWFCFARVMVDNSDATLIILRSSVTFDSESSPVMNQWYDLFGLSTGVDVGQDIMYIEHRYADVATANGKTMEVEGLKPNGGNTFAINLTELDAFFGTSYASMTAEQINAIKYDLLELEKTSQALRFDGVDDFVAFADTASLDITSAPLAIFTTAKSIDSFGYIFAKNGASSSEMQYSLYKEGTSFRSRFGNTISASSPITEGVWYSYGAYWDGVNLSMYVNGVQQGTPQSLVGPLISRTNVQAGARSNSADGTIKSSHYDGDIATVTIYTGSDINKILKAEAKISAEYLALNP